MVGKPFAEACGARASSAARKEAIAENTKVFFMVMAPMIGGWQLAEIISFFKSSGDFTSWEVDEIF